MTEAVAEESVQGELHLPTGEPQGGLVLAHGAGSNYAAPLLVAMGNEFAAHGYVILRFNLHFRRQRSAGSPNLATAALDRESIRNAVIWMRQRVALKVYAGGHSYGGRQATMLASQDPKVAEGLLLLSYPLHPPRKPDQLRTAHLPKLETRCLFIHGTRDPFGSPAEMEAALSTIPGEHAVHFIEGAGHDLKRADTVQTIRAAFQEFFS